jgi:hypothetical protein
MIEGATRLQKVMHTMDSDDQSDLYMHHTCCNATTGAGEIRGRFGTSATEVSLRCVHLSPLWPNYQLTDRRG